MQLFTPLILKNNSRILRWTALVLSVSLLVVLLSLTVFAQNTYVITDGGQVTVHTSFTSDPAKALDEAGVQLSADDFYTAEAVDGVSEITVQRAMEVRINNCGQTIQTNSYGETLEALLTRLGIRTSSGYSTSLPMDTKTYDGMEVTVSHTVQRKQTYTVEIPFETSYCYDPTLPQGQEKILVEGVPGQLLRSADAVYVNAVEQSRTVLEETVVQQTVNQLVAIGTGENVGGKAETIIGDGFIVLPTGEVLTYTDSQQFVATAYTKTDAGCDEFTATGSRVHMGVVAVDPRMIPYGTRMFIVTNDGSYIYGIGTAEDCGGSIKGNRLDLYFDSTAECFQFGRRNCTVYFLGDADSVDK